MGFNIIEDIFKKGKNMEGMALRSSIVNMAQRNGWGYGSFALKDGSSVKLCSAPVTGITRLFQIKNGRLISAEAAKGNNEVAAMIDKYAQKALIKDEVDYAFMNSFDMFM